MQKSVDRMSALIEYIMDFARGRMGSGIALERSTREPEPGLRQVVDELRATHPDRTIEAKLDLSRPMSLDPNRIARVLSNLLGNALTYGATDAPVFVRASTANGFELSVTNSGPDISPASMEQLFAPFTRGETSSDKKGSASASTSFPSSRGSRRPYRRLLDGRTDVFYVPDPAGGFVDPAVRE